MVIPAVGTIVLVRFPFSDLSQAKLRPAIVLAIAGRGDWILCQSTSNRYSDALAVEVGPGDFETGSLRITSYARPGKLFTGHERLMVAEVGTLKSAISTRIIRAVVGLLSAHI